MATMLKPPNRKNKNLLVFTLILCFLAIVGIGIYFWFVVNSAAKNAPRADFIALQKADRIEIRSNTDICANCNLVKIITDAQGKTEVINFYKSYDNNWEYDWVGEPLPMRLYVDFYSGLTKIETISFSSKYLAKAGRYYRQIDRATVVNLLRKLGLSEALL